MPDRTLEQCYILILEDEFLLAADLQDELERAGAIILGPAGSIDAARALLAAAPEVDGAVLDINLDGEQSYPIADELLERDVPFLFTTGYSEDAIPARYRQIARCQKPVRAAIVRDAIGRVVHA
jgi:response regulator RpfG family c-di-GMP phosphodiesterase